MKKRQENEVKTECASSATPDSWRTIDWASCERKVRKLQVRIVEALKANRIGRVKALQRILINSFSAKALAVRQVQARAAAPQEWTRSLGSRTRNATMPSAL